MNFVHMYNPVTIFTSLLNLKLHMKRWARKNHSGGIEICFPLCNWSVISCSRHRGKYFICLFCFVNTSLFPRDAEREYYLTEFPHFSKLSSVMKHLGSEPPGYKYSCFSPLLERGLFLREARKWTSRLCSQTGRLVVHALEVYRYDLRKHKL